MSGTAENVERGCAFSEGWADPPCVSTSIRSVPVEARGDVLHAQHSARDSARELGFPPHEAAELAIVASELATNILKYGVKGRMTFLEVVDPVYGRGIGIAARDHGPPFRSFADALEDGCDDGGPIAIDDRLGRDGLATGLGAVKRFSDRVGCFSLTPDEKEVRAVRFLRKVRRKP
jgi:serine/threonine-protein kinase RsbT